MRETIGSTWIFYLVIIFILIFAAYLALTINYSKSFRLKDEVLTIVEKYEGFTDGAFETVNNYLLANNYQESGYCPDGWFGVDKLQSKSTQVGLKKAISNQRYYYCVDKVASYNTTHQSRAYYKIRMFFKFNLPILGQISTFDVDGQTYEMDHTYDGL